MAHPFKQALTRKLRAWIDTLEEWMDVPRGLFAAELLEDHSLRQHAYIHLLERDLDETFAKMDALVEELGRDVLEHKDKMRKSSTDV